MAFTQDNCYNYESDDECTWKAVHLQTNTTIDMHACPTKPTPVKFVEKQNNQSLGFEPLNGHLQPFALQLLAGTVYQAILDQVVGFFQTNKIDYSVNTNKVFGTMFDASRHVDMKMEFVESKNEKYLQVYRMGGDAFLLNFFFDNLTQELQNNGFVAQEEEMEDISDFDLNWDEEFDSDCELDVEIPQCLQLDVQPEVVETWCERLETGSYEDVHSILLLLAHNAEGEANLGVINVYKQQLVQALFKLLHSTYYTTNLQVVRNVSKVLQQLGESGLIKLSENQTQCLCNVLTSWAYEKNFHESRPITCSQEIQSLLAQTLNFIGQAPEKMDLEELNEIATNTNNVEIKNNLNQFMSSITVF